MRCQCGPSTAGVIVRSNTLMIAHCVGCGAYYVKSRYRTEAHEADGETLELCEIVNSLIKSTKKEGSYET